MEELHSQGSGQQADPRAVVSLLREVVQQLDAGELEASSAQRAHLAGAIAALEVLDQPHIQGTGGNDSP